MIAWGEPWGCRNGQEGGIIKGHKKDLGSDGYIPILIVIMIAQAC